MRLWILLVVVVAASVGQAAMASDDRTGCDPMKIMICLTSAIGTQDVANSPLLDMPDTPEKLKEKCDHLKKLIDCVDRVVSECATEEEKQQIYKKLSDVVDLNMELCTEGSPQNRRFFASVDCFKQHSEMTKDCSIKFLENLRAVAQSSNTTGYQIHKTCCTSYEYIECARSAVVDCSKEAADFMKELMERSFRSSLNQCTKDFDIPAWKCSINAAVSHHLNITLLGILLFIVSSKTIFFNGA